MNTPIDHLRSLMRRNHGLNPTPQSALVIGLGRFGIATARRLVSIGVEVLGVDIAQDLVNAYAQDLTDVRQADATNVSVLTQLDATEFDAVIVAIGTNLEASILATSALIDLGCQNIWAKAMTDEHGRILERIGAHHVVQPERQAGERVAHVVTGQILEYFALDERFVIVEITSPDHFDDVDVADLTILAECNLALVAIKSRNGTFRHAHPTTTLQRGDLIVIAGKIENIVQLNSRIHNWSAN